MKSLFFQIFKVCKRNNSCFFSFWKFVNKNPCSFSFLAHLLPTTPQIFKNQTSLFKFYRLSWIFALISTNCSIQVIKNLFKKSEIEWKNLWSFLKNEFGALIFSVFCKRVFCLVKWVYYIKRTFFRDWNSSIDRSQLSKVDSQVFVFEEWKFCCFKQDFCTKMVYTIVKRCSFPSFFTMYTKGDGRGGLALPLLICPGIMLFIKQ